MTAIECPRPVRLSQVRRPSLVAGSETWRVVSGVPASGDGALGFLVIAGGWCRVSTARPGMRRRVGCWKGFIQGYVEFGVAIARVAFKGIVGPGVDRIPYFVDGPVIFVRRRAFIRQGVAPPCAETERLASCLCTVAQRCRRKFDRSSAAGNRRGYQYRPRLDGHRDRRFGKYLAVDRDRQWRIRRNTNGDPFKLARRSASCVRPDRVGKPVEQEIARFWPITACTTMRPESSLAWSTSSTPP